MDCEKSSKPETSPVFKLPTEMLVEIFHRVPFRDLLKCREVHSTWKSAATVQVRKRCAPINFSRKDIPSTNQRVRVVKSFIEMIRATNEQGGLAEFPVAKYHLELNEDCYWVEMNGSALICRLMEAVSPFVKEIVFNFTEEIRQLPNNIIATRQDLTFENLTEITLDVFERKKEPCDNGIMFSFIRNVIEKCPNVKEFHLRLDFYDATRSENVIRRCIVETGIQLKANLVTSLIMGNNHTIYECELEYCCKLGFKLKYFEVDFLRGRVNPEIWKNFLETQCDTLTTLTVCGGSWHYYPQLPCLPRLKHLSNICFRNLMGEQQLPTLFYNEKLPALKKMDFDAFEHEGVVEHYFMKNHLAPTESMQELVLGIEDAAPVIWQIGRIFPNLRKLQVIHDIAKYYMSDIYAALPGIEELCISTDGRVCVDDIITGLPGNILRKIRTGKSPPYHFSKALAMLDQGTTKTLACLENLKILVINRRFDEERNIVGDEDFTELSGLVLKQMKTLQIIDFGIRKYGPILSTTLKEDLEARGIKLLCRKPPYTRFRADFIESSTDSTTSDSDSD